MDAAEFLTHLILKLNNTATPAGSVETLTSDHGGEVLSNEFRKWLKMHEVFSGYGGHGICNDSPCKQA